MSVREQAPNVHVLVEQYRRIDLLIGCARWYHEDRVNESTVADLLFRRLILENDSDAGSILCCGSICSVVNLKRKHRSGFDSHRCAWFECHRIRARSCGGNK